MSQKIIFATCFVTLAIGFLSGCVNPYTSSYVSAISPGSLTSNPKPSKASARIIESSDLDTDISHLKAQGYVLLGQSRFQKTLDFGTSMELAIANYPARQAKIVGAEAVLLRIRKLGETTETGVESERKVDAYTGDVTYEDYNYAVAFTTYEYVAVFLRRMTSAAPVSAASLAKPP